MKNVFSKNYIKVCPNPLEGQMENRWKGVEEYCNQEQVEITDLTMMAFGLNTNEQFKTDFASVFQNIDMRFPDNSLKELSLLACICLMKLMQETSLNINIALSVMCLSKYNLEILVPELVTQAFECFYEVSAGLRDKKIKYKPYPIKSTKEFIKASEDLTTLDDARIVSLSQALSELSQNFANISENQKQTIDTLDILKEDSDILSWIIGSWSNELKQPIFKTTAQLNIALIIAKELADLVNVCPGPFAFEGFLKKMFSNCKSDTKSYSLVKMIDSVANDAKASILKNYRVNENLQSNTPLLISLKCANEANATDVWKSTASHKLSFNVESVDNTILEWAKLMYLECILVKLEGNE
jgi:hypothetical protein